MTGFIYPVVVGWCAGGGWLGDQNEQGKGYHDFAGSGTVHMLGGVAGFIGAAIVGPRHGKEKHDKDRKNVLDSEDTQEWINAQNCPAEVAWWLDELQKDDRFEPNSFPFVVFGTLILSVSWLFFNGGSTMSMFKPRSSSAPKVMMCTLLSGVSSGFVSAFLKPLVMGTYSHNNRYDVGALTNGIMAGFVAVTGVCDRCSPWSACLIGLIASMFYSFSCKALKSMGVDDPIEATMVHGACGLWGVIAVGIFDNKYGLVSDSMDSIDYLGWQLLGMIIIILWTTIFSLPYFWIMHRLNLLRVPLIHEVIGLDVAEMGSSANVDFLVAHKVWQSHMVAVKSSRHKKLMQLNETGPGLPNSAAKPILGASSFEETGASRRRLYKNRTVPDEEINSVSQIELDLINKAVCSEE